MNFFDANTWIGRWPFAFCEAHSPRSLVKHLKAHGIERSLVSPLDAVFAPEPGPANRALLRGTRGMPEHEPVPVINPALGNWREELARAGADPRVRAVRLLPNYHNYALSAAVVNDLVDAVEERHVRLIVQMRLIDERHEYHGMTLKAVPLTDLETFLKRHRRRPVLLSGLFRSEILPLARKHEAVFVDLSFAEWHDTLVHLLPEVPVSRLVFASHTPFLITAAARAKLETSGVSKAKLRAIAAENLERFLRR